jgi:hypothetical protein
MTIEIEKSDGQIIVKETVTNEIYRLTLLEIEAKILEIQAELAKWQAWKAQLAP